MNGYYPILLEGMAFGDKIGSLPQDKQKLAQQEKVPPDPVKGLGTQEIPRADGGKDKMYYSVTTPEEEKKAQQEEKEKLDKSWDMLRNIIIDRRNQ